MTGTDWLEWHRPYDDPQSPLSRRLRAVQARISQALDSAPDGPIEIISMCAGQGRDLIGVLDGHPRRHDVHAVLVEADHRNAVIAAGSAERAGLKGIEVVVGDAAPTDVYAGAVPAHLVLVCGVFGNISDDDIERTIWFLPSLCAARATVVWTRHRRRPDRTVAIREWFAQQGFDEVGFDAPEDLVFGVGAHRLAEAPAPFAPGVRLFTFTGDGCGPA
jgi:hypothetical protein